MNFFALVNPGLEKICQQEIKELLGGKVLMSPSLVEFELPALSQLPIIISRLQSPRRILVSLGKYTDLEEVHVESLPFPWSDFLPAQFSFKIEVLNVKGMDNRIELARKVAGKLFPVLEKQKFIPQLEMKKPDFLLVLFYNGTEYCMGWDCCGQEIDARDYRVFPHSASFKGDLAYYFMRLSGFKPGEKVLVGFVRDGGVAIEAALWAHNLPVRNAKAYSYLKFPAFSHVPVSSSSLTTSAPVSSTLLSSTTTLSTPPTITKTIVHGFDPNGQSIVAARKNAKIAGVANILQFQKCALDELDVRYAEGEFDRLIIHLTTKDEDKLNELYYQATYVLKAKGTLLLIARSGLEITAPDKFMIKEEQEIARGESKYKVWVIGKK